MKLPKVLIYLGNISIFISILFIVLTFGPATKEEVEYQTKKVFNIKEEALDPPNRDFAIVIPKIDAGAPIFANTNPFEKDQYLPILRRGVAHAAGTVKPGMDGNVYLFAHSTDAFYNVGSYNAVFYLLGKLEKGDEIEVYYQDEKYVYEVGEKKIVEAEDVKYLKETTDEKTLTLQTCYPPGTTLKRLIVIADQKGP